ncbi:MAG: hypothetical protein GYB64_04460 [Chloroflexi bacterium]|nr:hypothetical protein [Chloroflexota bacterium]
MPISVRRVTNQNIIVMSMLNPLKNGEADFKKAFKLTTAAAEPLEGRYIVIVDMARTRLSFSELVMALGVVTAERAPLFKDPDARLYIVGSGDLISLMAQAFRQTQYGKRDVPVFETLDQAITYATLRLIRDPRGTSQRPAGRAQGTPRARRVRTLR